MTQLNTQVSLISEEAFIRKMIGVPWASRACTFDTVDCWGLCVLYYRHVLGIELHQTPDYEAGENFFTCYESDVVFWRRSDVPVNDGIFVVYTGPAPAHVGPIVNHRALHSRGEDGGVRWIRFLFCKGRLPGWSFLRMARIDIQRFPGALKERHEVPAGTFFIPGC